MTYKDALLGTTLEQKEYPTWLWDIRQEAFDRFNKLGLPKRSDEAWRYINLEPVLGSAFLADEAAPAQSMDQELIKKYFLKDIDCIIDKRVLEGQSKTRIRFYPSNKTGHS